MASDEEACAVCGNDRGLKKNPIIFCDGQDCNLPVHQKCYHVSVIPDDQWFCERCEVKQKGIEPKVICCPSTDGALKKTTQGDFIHVVCALWNDAIRENDLPYSVPERLLNVKVCDICSKKTGLCVECERPKCTNRYHVTCAIKAGYIEPEPTMPAQYIFECPTHQPVRPARARGKPRRKAQQDENEDMETEDDSPNEKQSNDDDDDEGDSDEEASSDDQQESDDSDEMGLTPRKRSRNKLAALAKKRRGNDGKTRGNLQQLLLQDQSDSDDNMGSRHSSSSNSTTSSTRKPNKPNGPKPMDVDKSSSAKKEPNGHTNLSIGPASQRERFEAKRMKVDMKKTNTTPPSSPSLLNAKATPPATNQPSATAVPAVPAMPAVPALPTMPTVPPPGAPHPALALDLNKQPHTNKDTINTSVSSVLPNGAKQKLPNKSHLAPSMPKVLNGNPPSRPPASAIRKPSSSNIKDLNEIQNEMNANAQRWGMDRKNSQPTMDMSMIKNMIGEAVEMAMQAKPPMPLPQGPDPGMQQLYNRIQNSNQEIGRLKEELRRMNEFKRSVVDVFDGLNVRVPGRPKVNLSNIDEYVNDVKGMLLRLGPVDDKARDRIASYVQDTIKDAPSSSF